MVKRRMSIDIETYSTKDLSKCGVYAYCEDKEFEILLFGYAFDDEEVRVIDLKSGQLLSVEVKEGLVDPSIIKTAFNANFERTCIASYFKIATPPEQWSCTLVMALELGLPMSLDEIGKFLNLKNQKMEEGKALIRYFSMPCKGAKSNDFRNRNLPRDDKEKWEQFKDYCIRDVEVERDIRKRLSKYGHGSNEEKLWQLDQKINDRGVKVDRILIKNALSCDEENKEKLLKEATILTGLNNPKSIVQMKEWLFNMEGLEIESLSKEDVDKLLEEVENVKVKRALELRQELSKTSIKKYEAMERALCKDNRIRGLFQFYGANRTGRWAGRLVQVQNLPQNKLDDLDLVRKLLRQGQYEDLDMFCHSRSEVLSQLIRTAFIPSDDSRFIVADFSAIEARILSYLAGEKWRLDVFNSHGKIYEASASKMFNVPIESVTKGSMLRQKGKIGELALGYQGSKGALMAMGALNMGLDEEDLIGLVRAWRSSNSKIVKFWSDVERAAIKAVRERCIVRIQKGIEFQGLNGILFIKLPSGRRLSYIRPRLEKVGNLNRDILTYEGLEQGTKHWGRLKTYGGKLTENIVQAIARDCLGEAMVRLEDKGYKNVMHIHDEVVLDVPYSFGSLEEVKDIMGEPISWANDLILRAEAFENDYYKKD